MLKRERGLAALPPAASGCRGGGGHSGRSFPKGAKRRQTLLFLLFFFSFYSSNSRATLGREANVPMRLRGGGPGGDAPACPPELVPGRSGSAVLEVRSTQT